MRKLISASVAALMAASVAVADDVNSQAGFVTAVSGGIIDPDSGRGLDTGRFGDVSVGYRFGPKWEIAAAYLAASMNNDEGVSPAEIDPGWELDMRYHFSNGATQPYLALGLSDFRYDYDHSRNDVEGDTVLSAALGVKAFASASTFVNGEIKQVLDSQEGDTLISLGIGRLFGQASTPVYEPASKPAPAPVVAPEPETVVAAPAAPFIDSDKDGVEDKNDNCPATPIGVEVGSNGCALDDDKDGVPNYKDECPNTAAGARVDNGGCAIEFVNQKETLQIRVAFDTNSANLRPGSNTEIKKAADFLATYDEATLVIEGHTDNTGSAAYNKSLSQKRADAVRQVLISTFNIDPSRVTAAGFGEERPIADNTTAAGRQTNRRVVGVVEGQKSVRVKQQ